MESKFEEIWAVTASKSESGLARYGNIPHRYGWGRQVLYVAFVVLIFSLIIGVYAIIDWLGWARQGMAAYALLAMVALIVFGIFSQGRGLVRRWTIEANYREDRKSLVPSVPNGIYVGVSYGPGLAELRGDCMWDRGCLSIGGGFLKFKGLASSFELPCTSIDSVGVVEGVGWGYRVPLLRVRWKDSEVEGCVNIEIRESGKDPEATIRQYISRLEGMATLPKPVDRNDDLPLRSDSMLLGRSAMKVVRPRDHWRAFLLSVNWFLAGVAIVNLVEQLLHEKNLPVGFMGVIAVGLYSEFLKRQVREREAKEAEETEELVGV